MNDRQILKAYGITLREYQDRKAEQGNRCYVCGFQAMPGQDNRRGLCLDHCHNTGNLRKFLCNTCNMLVGMFENEPIRYLNIIQYVQDYNNGLLSGQGSGQGRGHTPPDGGGGGVGVPPDTTLS